MDPHGGRKYAEEAAGGVEPGFERAMGLLKDMEAMIRRQEQKDNRQFQELNNKMDYLKENVEYLEIQRVPRVERWIAEGAERQLEMDIADQPGPSGLGAYGSVAQPGPSGLGAYDSMAQPGPSGLGAYGSVAQPGPSGLGAYGSVAQPGPSGLGAYDSMAQPGTSGQGAHGPVHLWESAFLLQQQRSAGTESQDPAVEQMDRTTFFQEQWSAQGLPLLFCLPTHDSVMKLFSSTSESLSAPPRRPLVEAVSDTSALLLPSPRQPVPQKVLGEQLMWATATGRVEDVYELVEAGANVHHANDLGESALSIAVSYASTAGLILRVLRCAGGFDNTNYED